MALCQRRYPASMGPCVKPCEECREDVAFLVRVLIEQEFPPEPPYDFDKSTHPKDVPSLEDFIDVAKFFQRYQRQHTRHKLMGIATELDPDIQLEDFRSGH